MFSILTRFINAKYLIKTQHLSRITFGTVVGLTSFIIISVCCAFNTIPAMFQVSLVASILVGIQMAIGESTLLGFLKNFPGETENVIVSLQWFLMVHQSFISKYEYIFHI